MTTCVRCLFVMTVASLFTACSHSAKHTAASRDISVQGRVTYAGVVPEPRTIAVPGHLRKVFPEGLTLRPLVVDAGGGLAEALVYVVNPPVARPSTLPVPATLLVSNTVCYPRVLAVQDAPRGVSDVAPGGVHAGDVELARTIAAAPVELVVHRAVDDTSTAGVAKKPFASATAGVGAIDATPRYRDDGTRVLPCVLLLTVGEREMSWKALLPRVLP